MKVLQRIAWLVLMVLVGCAGMGQPEPPPPPPQPPAQFETPVPAVRFQLSDGTQLPPGVPAPEGTRFAEEKDLGPTPQVGVHFIIAKNRQVTILRPGNDGQWVGAWTLRNEGNQLKGVSTVRQEECRTQWCVLIIGGADGMAASAVALDGERFLVQVKSPLGVGNYK